MGNNNSSQGNNVDVFETEKDVDLLREFYAKDSESQFNKMSDKVHSKANKLYDRANKNNNIYIERRVEIFSDPSRGISLPYNVEKPSFSSDRNDQVVTSENPKYIEFVAEGMMNDMIEKYAVHKSRPNHECKKNCYCVEDMIDVVDNKKKIYNSNMFNKSVLDSSETSSKDAIVRQNNTYNMLNKAVLSPTSSEPRTRNIIVELNKSRENKVGGNCGMSYGGNYGMSYGGNCGSMLGGNCGQMYGGNCGSMYGGNCGSMYGGAERKTNGNVHSDTSPDDIASSSEQSDRAFSTTSEMSETSSPAFPSKKTDKKKPVNKNKSDDDDEPDIDDDELEGVDDEDITTENGFILEQSDIGSSDLYRMQSRVFGSETDDSIDYSRNNKNSRNSDYDDDEITDRVRNAMDKMNVRNNIFDSEDNDILNMNSSTDKYMKRPTKKNHKYN